jgi:hypothetical protein
MAFCFRDKKAGLAPAFFFAAAARSPSRQNNQK